MAVAPSQTASDPNLEPDVIYFGPEDTPEPASLPPLALFTHPDSPHPIRVLPGAPEVSEPNWNAPAMWENPVEAVFTVEEILGADLNSPLLIGGLANGNWQLPLISARMAPERLAALQTEVGGALASGEMAGDGFVLLQLPQAYLSQPKRVDVLTDASRPLDLSSIPTDRISSDGDIQVMTLGISAHDLYLEGQLGPRDWGYYFAQGAMIFSATIDLMGPAIAARYGSFGGRPSRGGLSTDRAAGTEQNSREATGARGSRVSALIERIGAERLPGIRSLYELLNRPAAAPVDAAVVRMSPAGETSAPGQAQVERPGRFRLLLNRLSPPSPRDPKEITPTLTSGARLAAFLDGSSADLNQLRTRLQPVLRPAGSSFPLESSAHYEDGAVAAVRISVPNRTVYLVRCPATAGQHPTVLLLDVQSQGNSSPRTVSVGLLVEGSKIPFRTPRLTAEPSYDFRIEPRPEENFDLLTLYDLARNPQSLFSRLRFPPELGDVPVVESNTADVRQVLMGSMQTLNGEEASTAVTLPYGSFDAQHNQPIELRVAGISELLWGREWMKKTPDTVNAVSDPVKVARNIAKRLSFPEPTRSNWLNAIESGRKPGGGGFKDGIYNFLFRGYHWLLRREFPGVDPTAEQPLPPVAFSAARPAAVPIYLKLTTASGETILVPTFVELKNTTSSKDGPYVLMRAGFQPFPEELIHGDPSQITAFRHSARQYVQGLMRDHILMDMAGNGSRSGFVPGLDYPLMTPEGKAGGILRFLRTATVRPIEYFRYIIRKDRKLADAVDKELIPFNTPESPILFEIFGPTLNGLASSFPRYVQLVDAQGSPLRALTAENFSGARLRYLRAPSPGDRDYEAFQNALVQANRRSYARNVATAHTVFTYNDGFERGLKGSVHPLYTASRRHGGLPGVIFLGENKGNYLAGEFAKIAERARSAKKDAPQAGSPSAAPKPKTFAVGEPMVNPPLIREAWRITGRVQAVGFRRNAANVARQYGLTGKVENRKTPNGQAEVYIEVQGSRDRVEAFRRWAVRGPWLARVDTIKTEAQKPSSQESGFRK